MEATRVKRKSSQLGYLLPTNSSSALRDGMYLEVLSEIGRTAMRDSAPEFLRKIQNLDKETFKRFQWAMHYIFSVKPQLVVVEEQHEE